MNNVPAKLQSIVPRTMAEALDLAHMIVKSGMAPKGLETPEKVLVAIMHGAEIGLPPMQSIQRIAVIGGRPTVWGDGALSLVYKSDLLEYIEETIDGDGDRRTAVCHVKRKNQRPTIRRYSVLDAKRAKLWGKVGPWQDNPDRQQQMRARAFALRDAFADVLGGMYVREEMEGVEPLTQGTPIFDIGPSQDTPPHDQETGEIFQLQQPDQPADYSLTQPENDTILNKLVDEGNARAIAGMSSLEKWWKGLTSTERKLLGKHSLDAWKKAAENVDAEL